MQLALKRATITPQKHCYYTSIRMQFAYKEIAPKRIPKSFSYPLRKISASTHHFKEIRYLYAELSLYLYADI